MASLVLHNGESAEFDVVFQPSVSQQIEGLIHLSIMDNQYEETTIQMAGEGYQDDVTLDNISSLLAEGDGREADRHLEEDAAEGEELGEEVRQDVVPFLLFSQPTTLW